MGSSSRVNGTRIPIAEVYAHKDYDNPPFDKDIAVFKTAERLVFDEYVQPIALPPMGRSMQGGSKVVVTGWGLTVCNLSSLCFIAEIW